MPVIANPWDAQAARRLQRDLAQQGWAQRLLVCAVMPAQPPLVTCWLGQDVRFWLNVGGNTVPYYDTGYLCEEAALLPLLAEAAFGITPSQLLDRGPTAEQVMQRLGAPLAALRNLHHPQQLVPPHGGAGSPSILERTGQDGWFVRHGPALLELCSHERGQVSMLGATAYPWVAALLVGGNLRSIDWARFN